MGIETATLLGYASAAATVVGAASSLEQQRKAKSQANDKPVKPQEAKPPDQAALLDQNRMSAALGENKGNSSTFLTGSGGVDPSQLLLGKNTLLGQ